jgi:hypothetical protein
MKRLLLILAGALVAGGAAATPAVAGLAGNPSFSHEIAVRVPTAAQTPVFADDHGHHPAATPSAATPADDRGGRSPHAEPGDDRGGATPHAEPGEDRGGATPHLEPGDDRGGASTLTAEPGDDRGGATPHAEPGDDRGGRGGGHGSGRG